jgi:predicted ribosomally synthesized peptide with nif11-like leader
MESMFNFIEKIKKDKTLSAKLEKLNAANDRDGIVAFMRENGVSEDDIAKGLEYENSFMTAETSELSDDDLESVAGGKGGVSLPSIPSIPGLPSLPGLPKPNLPDLGPITGPITGPVTGPVTGPGFPGPITGPIGPGGPGLPTLCRLFHGTPGGPCTGLHFIG